MWLLRKRNRSSSGLLISIGAGYNQIPLIQEAKNAGFQVMGVDQNSSAPGFSLCDLKIQESIANHEEIFRKVQEFLFDGKIKGVLTRSYGVAVKTTAYLNEYLNIPFIPSDRIDELIDKSKMKQTLNREGINTPPFYLIHQQSQIKTYPSIIKPLDGHAKQGVRYLENAKESAAYFSQSNLKGNYLCEQYLPGKEIIALGIVHKGKFILFDITDKVTTPLPHFVDVQHSAPSQFDSRWDEIEALGQNITVAFGIITSPLVIEIRFDQDNKPSVIEVVPEFGGEYLADLLIPLRSGHSFIRQAINAISGVGVQIPSRRKYKTAVAVRYITGGNGTIDSYLPLPAKKHKNVIYTRIFTEIGSQVKAPENNHDRLGVVIAKGKTVSAAISDAESAIADYSIRIKATKGK
ncbi:MAG TPA: ATP-grasp domain-containing protein [Spirochaetota bacterium]